MVKKYVMRNGLCILAFADYIPTFSLKKGPTIDWIFLEKKGIMYLTQVEISNTKAYVGGIVSNGNALLVDYITKSNDERS